MAKKKRDEAEIAATVAELPTTPPAGTIEELISRGIFETEVLLYRIEYCYDPLEDRRRKMALCHCTACREEAYLEYESIERGCNSSFAPDNVGFIDPADNELKVSHSTCICPCCGKGLCALHVSRFRLWYEAERRFCVTVHNVRGHLAILSWSVAKLIGKEGEVKYVPQMWEGSLSVGGIFCRVVGYVRNMSAVSFYSKWVLRKRGEDAIGACDISEIMPFPRSTVDETDSAHSALWEYISSNHSSGERIYPGSYLQLWTRHPNVENLVRQGLGGYVSRVLKECHYTAGSYYSKECFSISFTEGYVAWEEVKPHRMLGIEKSELHIAREQQLDALKLYKDIKMRFGIRLDGKALKFAHKTGIHSVYDLIDNDPPIPGYKVPIVRVLNYLQKQALLSVPSARSLINAHYLRDYWDMANKVYGNVDLSVLYPKSLTVAHDDMVRRVSEKENADINARIVLQLAYLNTLSWEDDELRLFIRPAQSHGELILEGQNLNHCVARYGKSYAEGRTSIFFIRHTDDPDTSFYTLEYKDGAVVQNRGKYNCERTPEVKQFEAAWLEHIKTITKETNKNGKRREEGIRVGA